MLKCHSIYIVESGFKHQKSNQIIQYESNPHITNNVSDILQSKSIVLSVCTFVRKLIM